MMKQTKRERGRWEGKETKQRNSKRETDRNKTKMSLPYPFPLPFVCWFGCCLCAGAECQFIFRQSFFSLPEGLCAEQRHTG